MTTTVSDGYSYLTRPDSEDNTTITVEDSDAKILRAPKSEARWLTPHRPTRAQVPLPDLGSLMRIKDVVTKTSGKFYCK